LETTRTVGATEEGRAKVKASTWLRTRLILRHGHRSKWLWNRILEDFERFHIESWYTGDFRLGGERVNTVVVVEGSRADDIPSSFILLLLDLKPVGFLLPRPGSFLRGCKPVLRRQRRGRVELH
jgi:hypothetical protein